MAEVKPQGEHNHCSAWKPPVIKDEPELCLKEEPEEFAFHIITVKTEEDEDESSELHQRPVEENREKTKGLDCGAEAGSSSDPLTQLHSDSSDLTDHSEDYCQEEAEPKRSYAMIPPDSCVTDHRPFSCSDCGKSFRRNSILKLHKLVHTGERPHKCSICKKSFRRKFTLHQHERTHTEKRPFMCSVCKTGFFEASHLTQHQTLVHHICPVCFKYCSDKVSFSEHLMTHVKEGTLDQYSALIGPFSCSDTRRFSCSECGMSFRRNSDLNMHKLVHTEERPYKCSVCEKTFQQKGTLNEHMKIHNKETQSVHSGEKPHECTDCEKKFTKKIYLKRHMTLHTGERPHTCTVCGKGFRWKSHLQVHFSGVHRGKNTEGILHQSILKRENIGCSDCGKVFKLESNLKTHMRIHTGEKPFVCSFCEKRFIVNNKLTRHQTLVHFICPACKVCFSNKIQLNSHLKTHVEKGTLGPSVLERENKPFSCPECGKGFRCEAEIKKHMLVHTGERPHKCSVCGKDFKEKGHLKNHMRTHSREKPFVCSVCNRRFTEACSLKRHARTHTEEGPLQ